MAEDQIREHAEELARRLVAGGMPEETAREVAAIGSGLSDGDVILRDGRGQRIPTSDLSQEVIERWGHVAP